MKRWMLDAIVGIISVLIFVLFLLILPSFLTGGIPYLVALLFFVAFISIGGYLIRDVAP